MASHDPAAGIVTRSVSEGCYPLSQRVAAIGVPSDTGATRRTAKSFVVPASARSRGENAA
jgi:hypothetical protein